MAEAGVLLPMTITTSATLASRSHSVTPKRFSENSSAALHSAIYFLKSTVMDTVITGTVVGATPALPLLHPCSAHSGSACKDSMTYLHMPHRMGTRSHHSLHSIAH
uniref:SFRICE_036363 n=1 Tax=Spodoptera frugiperda TaxID=7108 RepID=A0A2H1X3L8_SPOFR